MDFTFDGIKKELQDRLVILSNGDKIFYYSVYARIIDVIAFITAKIIYVCDALAREANWSTATKVSSLLSRSRQQYKYIPHRKIGAIGSVIVTADPNFSDTYAYAGRNISIPQWSVFKDSSKKASVYSTSQISYYTGFVGNLTIPVKEGVPKKLNYIAQGIADEIINVYSDSIDNTEIQIILKDVDGNILSNVTIVESLFFVRDLTKYYCQISNADDFSSIAIKFGNGITTKTLNVGQNVEIRYATTQGDNGNISSVGTIVKIDSQLYDEVSNKVTLYVNNIEAIADGAGYEDIISIKNNAPNQFSAGYRCGGPKDWVAIMKSISYVHNAVIWTVMDIGISNLASEQNKVYIAALTKDGGNLTDAQQQDVLNNYLTEKKSPSEVVDFQPVKKIHVLFKVVATVTDKDLDVMSSIIKNTIFETYSSLKVNFQNSVYTSNYIGVINAIPNVVHHETTISLMEKNMPYYTVLPGFVPVWSYNVDSSSMIDLVPDSCQLWLERKINQVWSSPLQIARVVLDGTTYKFIGMNGYTMVEATSFIHFDTNSNNKPYLRWQIYELYNNVADSDGVAYGVNQPTDTDPNGYIISVVYNNKDGDNLQQNNIRLPYRYQITDIDEKFIFTNLTY